MEFEKLFCDQRPKGFFYAEITEMIGLEQNFWSNWLVVTVPQQVQENPDTFPVWKLQGFNNQNYRLCILNVG